MRIFYIIFIFTFVMGCSTSKKTAAPSPEWTNVIKGTQWEPVTINGDKIGEDNTGPKPIYFMLAEEGNRFYGNGGCNSVNGMYIHSKPNHLEFTNIASTKMGCAKMEVERQFFNMLKEVNNYQLNGDTLVLKANKKAISKFIAN